MITTQPSVSLSEEQQEAVRKAQDRTIKRMILTGQAGAGKSTVINDLKSRGSWVVCATTGKAATHIGGATVDNVFCINRTRMEVYDDDVLARHMARTPDNILIDEASMVGLRMGNLIDEIATAFDKRIVLVGDWAQASPVKDDPIIGSDILRDHEFVKLFENHRQGEPELMQALNDIRLGIVTGETSRLMQSRVKRLTDVNDEDLRMYATNRMADSYNERRLNAYALENDEFSFRLYSRFHDKRSDYMQEKYPRSNEFMAKQVDAVNLAHRSQYAIGCRVLITRNSPECATYVNGDTGYLVGGVTDDGRELRQAFEDYASKLKKMRVKSLSIRLDRTGDEVTVERHSVEQVDAYNAVVYSITGFPVQLGYAVTIHKAQGMTVNRAWVDLASLGRFPDQESRHGLAYVALSRTRTLGGLYLSSWEPDMVYCDPRVRSLL